MQYVHKEYNDVIDIFFKNYASTHYSKLPCNLIWYARNQGASFMVKLVHLHHTYCIFFLHVHTYVKGNKNCFYYSMKSW